MTTSLVVAIFLFLISAAVMNYANQSLRTEAWMADRAQRSLYPIAWSTANFVLETLSGDLGANGKIINLNRKTIFVSGDLIAKNVISFDLQEISASIDITISGDSANRAVVNTNSPITVKVVAVGVGRTRSEVFGQIVSDNIDVPGIKIVWR